MRAYLGPAEAMLTAGATLAGYRIVRLLGAGGMGAVYLASHPSLPRQDAMKVLSAELSRDPEFRARFLREAEVASGLQHPNIVAIYDRGQADSGELWIAMQFVDGTDADQALRAGAMTPQRAAHIIAEVAKALDYAHSRNIVHRDIKPANFLLSGTPGPSERVLLGDFGIARALDDYGLTATGSVLATVAYAAPEVLAGVPFGGRADIYSLGCTLYRLLTGKPPFPATNGMAAVMMAHLQQPPPRVTAANPSLPAALDQVLAIAMAKDPAARFPTAAALAEATAAALAQSHNGLGDPLPPVAGSDVVSYPHVPETAEPWWQPDGARTQLGPLGSPGLPPNMAPTRPRRRRRAVAAGAAVTAAVVAAVVAIAVWPTGEPTPTASPPATPPPLPTTITTANAPATPLPPATNVAAPALRSILLSATQVNEITGTTLVLDGDTTEFTPDDSTVSNQQCLSVWAPAQPASFAGDGSFGASTVTGVAKQSLRALNTQLWQDGIVQAAVALASQRDVSSFMQSQRRRWAACAGALTITPPQGPPQTWTFSQPVTTAGVVTLTATMDGGGSCQRGLAARGNVILDVRQCRPQDGNDVTALISALSERVPRQ